jgi:hypothetical protein
MYIVDSRYEVRTSSRVQYNAYCVSTPAVTLSVPHNMRYCTYHTPFPSKPSPLVTSCPPPRNCLFSYLPHLHHIPFDPRLRSSLEQASIQKARHAEASPSSPPSPSAIAHADAHADAHAYADADADADADSYRLPAHMLVYMYGHPYITPI